MQSNKDFKKIIYQEIALYFNTNKIKHSLLHGINYDEGNVGRDVDLLIKKEETPKVLQIIREVFQNNKIIFRIVKFHWGYWILGYKQDSIRYYFIELDLLWYQNYRITELTDPKHLNYNKLHTNSTKEFYINYWNVFAKIFLIRFLANQYENLSQKRIKEIETIASKIDYSPHCSWATPTITEQIISACNPFQLEELKAIRNEIHISKSFLHNPLHSLKIFFTTIINVIDRKLHAFDIIPMFFLDFGDCKSNKILDEIKEILSDSFITDIKLIPYQDNYLSRLWSYIKIRHLATPLNLILIYREKAINKRISYPHSIQTIKVYNDKGFCLTTHDIIERILQKATDGKK